MKTRKFGETGKKVFVVGMGTFGYGSDYRQITEKEAAQIFNAVFDRIPSKGFFLIDTAPKYGLGKCEKWIGRFVKESGKDNLLIATKGGRHIEQGRVNEKDFSQRFLKRDLDNSLQRLSIEQVFLYQLHNPALEVIREGSVFDWLEQFRAERKIGFYGVSIDSPEEGIAAIDVCRQKGYNGLASIQAIYNILNKKAEELFEKAKKANVSIIAREPLLRGFLSDKYYKDDFSNAPPAVMKEIKLYGMEQIFSKVKEVEQALKETGCNYSLAEVAIKFASLPEAVTVTIPGINELKYVEADLNAASITLSRETLSRLQKIKDLGAK